VRAVGKLLTSCSELDRSTLAALVDADRSWVGPGLQLRLGDVTTATGWRRTFTIGPCAGFVRVEAERFPAGMLGVVTIWVRPARRRSGVATAALQELRAARHGLDCLEALVDRDNRAALACFAAAGFAATGTDVNGLAVLRRSLLEH
jgi:RimJ/RimL family protein N-acetyltransferase